MRARYVPRLELGTLLDPDGAPWRGARPVGLKMLGTPLALQPTAAIQVSLVGKKIGAVGHVDVSAVHDGSLLAFRLEWSDPTESVEVTENTMFVDGAAVLLPVVPESVALTMGAPGLPVNGWYWRGDEEQGREVVAEGIGTTRTVVSRDIFGKRQELVHSRGIWKSGRWHVVIARALRVDTTESVAQLEAGGQTGFAVAIWDGGSGERAGIKSFSGGETGDWQELQLDNSPQARR